MGVTDVVHMQDLAATQRRAAPSTDDDPMGAPARRGASIPGFVPRAHLGLAHLNGRQVRSARHLPHAPSGRARALPPRPALPSLPLRGRCRRDIARIHPARGDCLIEATRPWPHAKTKLRWALLRGRGSSPKVRAVLGPYPAPAVLGRLTSSSFHEPRGVSSMSSFCSSRGDGTKACVGAGRLPRAVSTGLSSGSAVAAALSGSAGDSSAPVSA